MPGAITNSFSLQFLGFVAFSSLIFFVSLSPVAAFSTPFFRLKSNKKLSPSRVIMFNQPWQSGTDLLEVDPVTLSSKGETRPQLAKDTDYASAILKAWKADLGSRPGSSSVAAPLVYECQGDGSSLYGHIYRISVPTDGGNTNSVPGIILFHTGAGPQDIFLRWKADSLVNDKELFGEDGCVVLIADILGDESGWAWYDRPRYEDVRKSVLVPDKNGQRNNLKCRVKAAIDAISSQSGVDTQRIGAMGFCLGGHPILELARMKDPSVKVLSTFHGVFDGVRKLSPVDSDPLGCHVLVNNGADDPFISVEDLNAATAMFQNLGYQCDVMNYERARHGFTNPAQDFNPSPSFGYNDESYNRAWSATRKVLKEKLT